MNYATHIETRDKELRVKANKMAKLNNMKKKLERKGKSTEHISNRVRELQEEVLQLRKGL